MDMGATTFSDTTTAGSAKEAYWALVSEARYEHGNDGYTGSISESHGFKMVSLLPGESLAACEERVIETAHENDRAPGAKGGPAACVDLGPAQDAPGLRRFAFFGWAAC
jgi:hypothetical protein